MLKLILEHGSNPDIHGYWQTPTDPRRMVVEVANISEAARTFCDWRERNGLGGGNMTKRSGELQDSHGKTIGRFSYNGRFWDTDGDEVKEAAAS